MEAIVSLLKNFDLNALLPELSSFIGGLKLWLFLLLLVGPVLLLVLGAAYYFKPPKEANYAWGFRTYFTMGSVEVWQFTQRLAGMIWLILGGALTVIMLIVGLILNGQDAGTLATGAIWCVGIELALVVSSWIAINVIVLKFFDKDGNRRPNVQQKKAKKS